MFENIKNFFKKASKKEKLNTSSKDAAKERLHLVLMQDRANVSADFLDLMRQEIIEVIKKYIDIDESAMDVRLTNQANDDGTQGAPALYANIPIVNIKEETRKLKKENSFKEEVKEEIKSAEQDEETKKIQEEAMKIVEEEQKDKAEKESKEEDKKEEKVEKTEKSDKNQEQEKNEKQNAKITNNDIHNKNAENKKQDKASKKESKS